MVQGCGNSCIKLLLFAATFAVFLGGALIFGVCLAATFSDTSKEARTALDTLQEGTGEDIPNLTKVSLITLTVVGGFIMLTGFLGCCGTWTESRFLLGLFIAIISVLFLVMVALFVMLLVWKGKLADESEKGLQALFKENTDKAKEARKALIPFMEQLECCGAKESDLKGWCAEQVKQKAIKDFNETCEDKIGKFITDAMNDFVLWIIVVLIIQALTIIFSCVMYGAFARKYSYYN